MDLVKEKDMPFRHGDWGIKYLFRGPRLDWGVVVLRPGEKMGAHYHEQVEETFFILEGEGKFVVDGKEVPVEAGTGCRLEPGERHDLVASSRHSLRGVFIKTPYLPDDKKAC